LYGIVLYLFIIKTGDITRRLLSFIRCREVAFLMLMESHSMLSFYFYLQGAVIEIINELITELETGLVFSKRLLLF